MQLTVRELPVLLSFLPKCEFGNHGNTNKGFNAVDCYRVSGLLLRRLHAQMPELDGDAAILTLDNMAKLHLGN